MLYYILSENCGILEFSGFWKFSTSAIGAVFLFSRNKYTAPIADVENLQKPENFGIPEFSDFCKFSTSAIGAGYLSRQNKNLAPIADVENFQKSENFEFPVFETTF